MPPLPTYLRTVLFDLDGTLLDTAPDLAAALNHVRTTQGLATLADEAIRPHVSHGAAALIRYGFELDDSHPDFESLRQQLLGYYAQHLADHTRPFPGIPALLAAIESAGLNWGVVTNKPERFTIPLLTELGLHDRAACIVCGDTLEEKKPHPRPLLHACELAGSRYHECVYIGDARRDIEAGQNAGMHTLVALFGYIGDGEHPENWGAEGLVSDAGEIMDAMTKLSRQ